jgi:large subunit ribosomal protein L24
MLETRQADVEIPAFAYQAGQKNLFQTTELAIPLEDVRLVHRLPDPQTGTDRDVVVQLLRGGAPYYQQEYSSPLPRHTRYIAGEDIEIPWPKVDVPEADGYEGDTTQYDVEHKTFQPTIYTAPVPPAVFEELTLRTKYSPARRQHDDEYMRLKVLEDARAEWYRSRKMQDPRITVRQERVEKKAAERSKRIEEDGMSLETQQIIEQAMLQAQRFPHQGQKEAKRTALAS